MVETRDEDGGSLKAWPEDQWILRWGSISTSGGREFWKAQQLNSDLSHEVVIHWEPRLLASWKVGYDDPKTGLVRIFEIISVANPDETRMFLHLFCTEIYGGK